MFPYFNMRRIYPTMSKWIGADGEETWGHVQKQIDDNYQCFDMEIQQIVSVPREKVTLIDRPGNLHHFYINHPDTNLREKLDRDQGVLLGLNHLEMWYGADNICQFVTAIGQFISIMMIVRHIIPTDIEIVIGSNSRLDRTPAVYIYDFNETGMLDPSTIKSFDHLPIIFGNSLHFKNGKKYFPNIGNKYYEYFQEGFVSVHSDQPSQLLAKQILYAYQSKVTFAV